MHDLYYKGRIHTRENHVKAGYNTKRAVRLGTHEKPLTLTVQHESRQAEIEAILEEHQLIANIILDETSDENINELMAMIDTPKTAQVEKVPGRNDPCICSSGKKYKKCCG